MHAKIKIPARRGRSVPKRAYACYFGPMNGQVLYLTSGHTLVFTMKGETGRYVTGPNGLVWELHGSR